MRRAGIFSLSLIIFGCCGHYCNKAKNAKIIRPENPKIAAYWTSPVMSEEDADSLSRFHLVIADMENMINNHGSLEILKGNGVKLICYSNPMELFEGDNLNDRPLQKQIYHEVLNERSGYWLKQPSGEQVIFWRGMKMLNLSSWCPEIKGEKYVGYLAKFLVNKVLNDKIWNGYFMDNSGANVSWIGVRDGNQGVDADNDGTNDETYALDSVWQEGIDDFLSYIRASRGANFIMIGNKGSLDFANIFQGKMFEEFPCDYLGDKKAGGWYQCLENYFYTGSYSIIHAKLLPDSGYRKFVLASALLRDGYYAYAQDVYRYFPEYKRDLGTALGPAHDSVDFWEREYSHAIVRVWPEEERGEIDYR